MSVITGLKKREIMKKISIQLPYYNDSKFLAQSIQSALNQTYKDFELILINHASTDNSEEIAKSFKDKRIKHAFISKNQGAGGGIILQTFLDVATGDYFKSMCADDIMKPDCLETLLDFLNKNKSFGAVFGNMDFINEEGDSLNQNWYGYKKVDLNINLLKAMIEGQSILPYPAALVRMEEMRKIEANKTMYGMIDMSLWAQILCNDVKIKMLRQSVCDYRIHPEQMSSSSKMQKILRMSNFESIIYSNYFFEMSLSTLKKNLPDITFAKEATQERFKDFILAHYFINRPAKQNVLAGMLKMQQILQDEDLRLAIEEKFGYMVKDLRDFYSSIDLFSTSDLSAFKSSKLRKELKRRFKRKLKSIFGLKNKNKELGVM